MHISRVSSFVRTHENTARPELGQAVRFGRIGFAAFMGLLVGSHVGGYVAWAQNAKTVEAGAAAVIVSTVVTIVVWVRGRDLPA